METDTAKINLEKASEGHYVIGGNTNANELSDEEVVAAIVPANQCRWKFSGVLRQNLS